MHTNLGLTLRLRLPEGHRPEAERRRLLREHHRPRVRLPAGRLHQRAGEGLLGAGECSHLQVDGVFSQGRIIWDNGSHRALLDLDWLKMVVFLLK